MDKGKSHPFCSMFKGSFLRKALPFKEREGNGIHKAQGEVAIHNNKPVS
jgi:hypothetical protein